MLVLAAGDSPNPLGHVLDMSVNVAAHHGEEAAHAPTPAWLTIHIVQLVVVTLLVLFALMRAAKAIGTGPESEGNDRYITKGRFAQFVEVIVLYLRDTVIRPVLGASTDTWLPFLLSIFFFILGLNLMGLVPLLDLQHLIGVFAQDNAHFAVLGGTPTANLAVTGGLALCAFVAIQLHAFKQLGLKGWAHHLLGGAPAFLAPLMVPIELLGMLIKPCALAIRLFANMLAGHTLMATLATFGMMALMGLHSWVAALGISVAAGAASVAISFLELFVAFLQAFIFMFLTAVFLGQMNHHGDHDHEHGHDHGHDHDHGRAHAAHG